MNDFDITAIEDTVKGLVRTAGVSQNVFTNRPKASSTSANDFVVVSVSGKVDDVAAYGQCKVMIYLFARDVQAFKNGAKLSKMYKAFIDEFPGFAGKYEFDGTPFLLGDVADDFGFHARVIEMVVNIKSIE